jgi:hypothetical protein
MSLHYPHAWARAAVAVAAVAPLAIVAMVGAAGIDRDSSAPVEHPPGTALVGTTIVEHAVVGRPASALIPR